MEGKVEIKDNQVVVSSRQVAGNFNKRHDHILRDIETLKKDLRTGHLWKKTENIFHEPGRIFTSCDLTYVALKSRIIMGYKRW